MSGLQQEWRFFLLIVITTRPPRKPDVDWVLGTLVCWGKWPVYRANNSIHPSAEDKNDSESVTENSSFHQAE